MSQNRVFFVISFLFAVGLAVGCGGSADLQAEVKALSDRVATLETKAKAAPSAASGAFLDQQAQAALGQITQLVGSGKIDEAKKKLKADSAKYAASKYSSSFRSMSQELAVIGKNGPTDWGLEKWFQGEDSIDLSSNGTTVVVFWESWCPHCRREVPKMERTYNLFKDQGLQVIGVTKINKSATEETVKQFIAENNVTYPMAKEDGRLTRHFNVSGIPAAAVVKNGKVVWRGHPLRITNIMLKNWLAS